MVLAELRGAIMAQRVTMARDHVRSLRIDKLRASKSRAYTSARCAAMRGNAPRTCGWGWWRTAGSCVTSASLHAASRRGARGPSR